MSTTFTQIQQYQDAIESKIKARFPVFNTVKPFPQERLHGEITLPAFLYEINELEAAPSHDGGSGQAPVDVRVECHLLFSFTDRDINRRAPALAADVLAFAHKQRWGVPCEPCETIGAAPDSFNPELEQYCVWRVDWHQVLDLGDNVWANDPDAHPPTQIFVGEDTPVPAQLLSLPVDKTPITVDPYVRSLADDGEVLRWLE